MLFDDRPERYFVYAFVDGRGWQLRHGNLSNAAAASAFAQSLCLRGIPVRIERQLTLEVSSELCRNKPQVGPKSDSIPANIQWWVKVAGMLEQNWAVLSQESGRAEIRFMDDRGQVFDQLSQSSRQAAERALSRNGFQRLNQSPELQRLLHPPTPPFSPGRHPNGRLYSSGRVWN